MTTATATLRTEDTGTVRKALRRLRGRATLGDVSAETGLSQARAEAALRQLLEQHRGHLEVGERGDLVYRFEPDLIRRDAVPLWQRVKENAWSIFKTGFKIWIVAMLVIYFLVFLALMIAAIFAGDRDGDGGWDGGGGHRGGGHMHFPNFWFWYLIWSPDWGWGRPYYGERHERRGSRRGRGRRQGPPFYKKVFAFVFGPDRPEASPERRDRDHLRFIRARSGAVSAADLVQATGMGLDDAESELARLMAAHDGDVEVTEDGTLVYTFPSLAVSAGEAERRSPPPTAWRRLEPELPLTGNSAGTNLAIAGMNTFTLAAAATAPWFIFPRLGIGGTLAEIGLIWIPVIFSAAFFAVPLLRLPSVLRENARRAARNVRRVLLGLVSRASLSGETPGSVELGEAESLVAEKLKKGGTRRKRVSAAMDRLVAEFDGEVEVEADGRARFSFPGFRRAMAAAAGLRERLGLPRGVGERVYDTADDGAAQGARDLAAFDRELARGAPAAGAGGEAALAAGSAADAAAAGPGTDRTAGRAETGPGEATEPLALPAPSRLEEFMGDPDRFAYRDELELAALEEEMRRKAAKQPG